LSLAHRRSLANQQGARTPFVCAVERIEETMMLSPRTSSKIVNLRPLARAGASRSRRAAAVSLLCFAAPWVGACSADDGEQSTAAPTGSQERSGDSFETDAASAAKGTVRLGHPFFSGTCTKDAAASIRSENERYVTAVFDNQQYAGDRDSPDYIKGRTEGRLIGDAKSTAPKCMLHIPMKVTAGYRLSPTNIILHGFAHRGFVYGAYRWANAALPSAANGYDVTNDGYTFERQVPPNEPAGSTGEDFVYTEPLYNLWSPTCTQSGSAEVDAELIVTLQPYTAAGTDEGIVAIDAFDVAGFGAIEKCDKPTSYDQVAQEGEDCGIIEKDYVHPVRCDTAKQTNICVYYPTNQETGTCVNASQRPASTELVVSLDGDCGGPFYKYCDKSEPLVCQFASGDARQNASSHFGSCVQPLAVGAECRREIYGACDGYNCNTIAEPCESGSKCTNGKCVATKGTSP
jgi:hypothetical protein